MKYPMLNNWLKIKRINKYEFEVHDYMRGEIFTMDSTVAQFIRKLNGKRNPYLIDSTLSPADVNNILNELDESELLRNNMIVMSYWGSIYLTIWIPGRRPFLQILAKLFNNFLMYFWLPVFIIGVFLFMRCEPFGIYDQFITGSVFGIIIGSLFHELGHAFAGIAYGARVFEMGVMIHKFIPGAYVFMTEENVKSKMKRIQINAAGIEANIMTAGICLILACVLPLISATLSYAAVNNVFLALINITFVEGLDGTSIISELLGIEDLTEKVKLVLCDRKIRKKLCTKGLTGHAIIVVSILIQLLQVTLPLLIILSVVEVILCFV